jgi:hypothetical protein
MFVSWADYLYGHEGADKTNKCISDLGGHFQRESIPLEHLKGEEPILFMGITLDGSPLFLHHITDLGSTRQEPDPSLVALVGFQTSTTVIGMTLKDSFQDIPNKDEDTIEVPPFTKLAAATTASAFKKVETTSKSAILETLGLLLPVPPFLIPCIASNFHISFKDLATPALPTSRTRKSPARMARPCRKMDTAKH